ncbi:Plasmid stabilization system protein ParE [Flavobacterium fryxellicola]|uniref:Plasmid stabilization protein n=1 Tax=Flavobacterium fryxellicola TaxID=249352 RepID=A0A167Y3I2_9FLAO|nr:type II toxin-antitoxin system RelE/ParE family toxin [Flavobacterium fryxellicola]OAB28988.1 hypothetical protein FBFR_05925 [Flavobacterium fryxellicola]SHN59458.1 Plasmid stabilization system protein ParE [Flavobacterium fryxellicola]
MHKSIKWSSFADKDLAKLLEYLDSKWNKSVCLKFINHLDSCITLIQQNPKQFPVINNELQIRKCVITKQNSLYYRETDTRIEILRLYDTRQNPENLLF